MSLHILFMFLVGLPGETMARHDTAVPCSYINYTFDKDLCYWTPSSVYGLEWKRHSDGTPIHFTGPPNAHTSGNGDYIYTSIDDVTNKQASLISSFLEGGLYCLSVWYQISGSNVSLEILKKENERVFLNSYSYGNKWQHSLIEISSEKNFKIDIRAGVAMRDSRGKGVIAIDGVTASKTSCPLDCSFDSGLCAWRMVWNDNQVLYNWFRTTNKNGTDHYLHIVKYANAAGRAVLQSSWQNPGLKCLSFQFRVAGIADYKLNVIVERIEEDAELILTLSNKAVKLAYVEINSSVLYKVLLVGEVQAGKGEDIYIKTIASVTGQCPRDCNSSTCLNGAICQQSNTDDNCTCTICSEGCIGQYCTDIVSTTEAPSTTGLEPSTSSYSTQSKNEQEGIIGDSISTSYIVIPSAGVVLLFIVGTVVALLILRRSRQRKRRLDNNNDIQRQLDNTNETTNSNDHELNELVYEQIDAENTVDVFKRPSHNVYNDNDLTEAQYKHTDNVPRIQVEENVYNHLKQCNVKPVIDQTYSHIPIARCDPNSAGEKNLPYLNVETQEELRRIDKNNLEEESVYNVLETSKNSKR